MSLRAALLSCVLFDIGVGRTLMLLLFLLVSDTLCSGIFERQAFKPRWCHLLFLDDKHCFVALNVVICGALPGLCCLISTTLHPEISQLDSEAMTPYSTLFSFSL